MKSRYFILTFILFFIFSFNKVYANNWGETGNTGEAVTTIEETGETIYTQYQFKEPTTQELLNLYTYIVSDGYKEALKILDNTIYMKNGQLILTPIPNNGNINNLEALKSPENFNKMFKINMNAWNHTGQSYITSLGKNYPTTYPHIDEIHTYWQGKTNYNYKDISHNPYTKIIDSVKDENKLFWTSPDGIKGNFRKALTRYNQYIDVLFFPRDIGTSEFQAKNSVVWQPWTLKKFGIMEGRFNKKFREEFIETGKISQKWIQWYDTFCVFNKNLKESMIQKTNERGLSPTLENQTRVFFEGYYAVHDVPTTYTNGYAEEIHSGGKYYASIATGMYSSLKNIRVASPEYGIGSYNTLEIFDKTGKKINPTTDILKKGEEYEFRWYAGFENSSPSQGTYNNSIKTNLYILYNNNTDMSHADMYFADIESENFPNTPLKPISDGYRIDGNNSIGVDFPENIAIYKQKVTIPENPEIEKITVTAQLPWQHNFYQDDDIEKNDNQKPEDDSVSLEIAVEQPHQNDLMITKMWLEDDKGSEIKTSELEFGKTYTPCFIVKNIGENPTTEPVVVGITNNYLGQTFSEYRNDAIGHTITTKILQKGEEIIIKGPQFTVDKYISSFDIYSWIHSKHDNKDNIYIYKDDVKKLTFFLQQSDQDDNAVTNIQLFDTSGKEYNSPNPDGSYFIEPQGRYYAIITVKKLQGTNQLTQPNLLVRYETTQGQGFVEQTLHTNQSLAKAGDTIQYKLDNIIANNGYITIQATLPYNDINITNNTISKTWLGYYNFSILNFDIQPNKEVLGENENYTDETVAFSATLTYQSFGTANVVIEDVPLEIRDSNNNILYREDVTFYQNKPIQIDGILKSGNPIRLREGNNVFRIGINGGETGTFNYRKYHEITKTGNPYSDNEKSDYVFVEKIKPPKEDEMLVCDSYNLRSEWTTTFSMYKKTGTLKSKTVTYTNSEGKTKTKTISWCENVSTESWEETKNYFENFAIEEVMFRSPTTIDKYGGKGWVNILGNPDKAKVRAGQWFEFYITTHYKTNRTSMPSQWRKNKCNYQNRSPDSIPVYGNPEYISLKIAGYGQTEYYPKLYPWKTQGSWSDKRIYFRITNAQEDIFGETDTRRYIPVTGKNGQIKINIITKPFNGYVFDENHPREVLQDCRYNITINVEDQLPIKSQIIGN